MLTRTLRILPKFRPSCFGVRQFSSATKPQVDYRDTKEYAEDSIYQRDHAFDIYRRVHFPTEGLDDNENKEFRTHLNELFEKYRPSKHSFFKTLAEAPSEVVRNPDILREMYVRYQAAMHSTRVSVYFTPFLNTPRLRQMKVKIILDDDTVDDVLSHHKQLENMFVALGAQNVPEEEEFGDIEELIPRLDKDTARFVETEDKLYRSDLGAWTILEILSDDWISGLADGFGAHFDKEQPGFVKSLQYFDEIATGHVEIQHMLETLALTENVLSRYPHMLQQTIDNSTRMAQEIDGLWDNLEGLIKNPDNYERSMI